MNAIQSDLEQQSQALAELTPSPPLLRTLMACDLVESTALTQQLGDRGAADFMHRLDRQTRDLLQRHGGQEIDKTDGFLLMFERPIQAVAFALDYQRLLRAQSEAEFLPLRARIGIHVGDVVMWRNAANDVARGAKPVEIEGLVKPVAARLMTLALPGQILLSGVAHTLALRAQDELKTEAAPPQWRSHGRYLFKGVAEPMMVFEVGEADVAPLRAPAYSSKAHREIPWWRRPGILAVEVAVLIAAVVVPAYIFLRSPPAIAFGERDWVVVGDLKNLTEEPAFNDSLQTAFRMGLEQSRYVNVLSDLKVRDTVKLMQRDPEKTPIDRAVGAEVAIRDGARALILPTIAEIGGHVRITAEVIDPQTQATVYTESVDGTGMDSALPSIDKIDASLRLRLGEALASVSNQSQPLDKVATKNLDALRAFSLAQFDYDNGKLTESMNLYREALKLDPGFALARIHLARSLLLADRRGEAVEEVDTALQGRNRLNPRDALYAEAWRASLSGSQRNALEKLKMLAKLYPDYFTAQSLFAYFSFEFANRFDGDVIAAAERAASPKNPHPLPNELMLGLLYLSNEQYDRAAEKFAAVERQSPIKHFVTALPYAARREFDKADAAMVRATPSDAPGANIDRYIPRAAIAFDSGQRDDVWKMLAEARKKAAKDDPRFVLIYSGIELSLRAVGEPREKLVAALTDYANSARDALAKTDDIGRSDIQFQVLFAAYLSARLGDPKLAELLVAGVGPEPASGDYPTLEKMLAVAQAEILRAQGKPNEVIERLKSTLDGSELFLAHATLMEAYSDSGDATSAVAEAKWLTTHRGRAYAENNMQAILMPLNAALSGVAQEKINATTHAPKVLDPKSSP